jgi:Ca-activated chloride channel family protein
MKIEAALTYDTIRHDQDHNAHLVISLTAPLKEGEEARPPICVVPVIDVSGSMQGLKLDAARRSAIKLVEHLRPGDYTGLIVFESRVHVIVPPQKVTPEFKERVKAEIGKIHTMGGTNFAGGMLKAIELVNALDLPEGVINRIIMLTDGQANEGPATKKDDLIKLFAANAGRVTASAFGYGNDVSQELLSEFAREAKGNYAYIQEPDAAITAFGKELGGLVSTYATDLVLELNGLAGHEILNVVSDVDADAEDVGGEVVVKFPEILAEERRDIVLAVKLKAQKQAFPRAVNAFDVRLAFETIALDGKKESKTGEVKAKAHFVKPGDEVVKPNEALDRIVALAEVIRAQIEAEEKAKKGQFVAAAAVMHNAAAFADSRGHTGLAAAANHTAGSVSNAANYNADQGYLTSFRTGGTRGVGVSHYEAHAATFLADAGVQMSTSTQTSTSQSFTGDVVVAPLDHVPAVAGGGVSIATTGAGLGSVIQNPGFGPGAILNTPSGSLVGAVGSIAAPDGAWTSMLVAPPPSVAVPRTNTPDSNAKREQAIEKGSKKISKHKSSARW